MTIIILKSLHILNPNMINSTSASTVVRLASMFSNIISEDEVKHIDTEWREIQFMDPLVLSIAES